MFNADRTKILLDGEIPNVQNEIENPSCFSDVCSKMPYKSEKNKNKKLMEKRRFLSMLQSSS